MSTLLSNRGDHYSYYSFIQFSCWHSLLRRIFSIFRICKVSEDKAADKVEDKEEGKAGKEEDTAEEDTAVYKVCTV